MSFTTYKITHCQPFGTGKHYVGLTRRTLQDRLTAHFNESTREKPTGISPYTLGYAIRNHLQNFPQVPLEDAFAIELLQAYTTLEEMRDGEAYWIDNLQTMAPAGFNLMRGGSSVGGPSNAKPCEIFLDGRLQSFSSFTDAAKAVAHADGLDDPIDIKRFIDRAKTKMHAPKPENRYSLAEALGIEPREDGRWTTVSRAAKASGRSVDTERSSQQRQKKREQRKASGVIIGPLPCPHNPTRLVSQTAVFEALGIKPSTGRYRLAQIAEQTGTMTPREIHDYLQEPQDRSKPMTVKLPNGQLITLGVNALANAYARPGHTVPAIKARLRKLGANPDNEELLIAIGLAAPPAASRKTVTAHPISRKKHCSDWTISRGTRSKTYINQKCFVEACHQALLLHPHLVHWLGNNPTDKHKAHRSLQFRISSETRDGKTPQQLAESFGIIADLLP